ncbi:MAG: peroxidase [Leptolyngbya sp. SIO4C1]|nr:peroxidase [Leptolyngbya sp. SIO4C1]
MKHGNEQYFIKNSGWITGTLIPFDILKAIFKKYCPWYLNPTPDPVYSKPDVPPAVPERVFCRLFDEGEQPDAEGLIELGLAMEQEAATVIDFDVRPDIDDNGDDGDFNDDGKVDVAVTDIREEINRSGDANIPAGYTYLGQFIDHDITRSDFSRSGFGTPTADGTVNPEDIINRRTPALDLDCLYGNGPVEQPELFEADGVHMRVGTNSATPDGAPGGPIPGDFPNDLPRTPDKKAVIGDSRNDENLAVAQTHLAFIKFHNKIVDRIAAETGLSGSALFDAARKEVVLHYQSLILHDFLPRLVQADVLADVLQHGRRFYTDEFKDCMPIEFSVAAYRLGHSMVRPVYEWNKVFNSNPSNVPATMELLFEFSEVSGSRAEGDDPFFGSPNVPANWIIDWTRFYDFSNVDGVETHPQLNFAREIDSKLSFALRTLPEFQKRNLPDVFISLATRNLLRGRLVKLPSGQAVAKAMQQKGIEVEPIRPRRIARSPHKKILRKYNFQKETPLWYYILREAKVVNDGNRLGPVGSRIVAEVFVGLIEHSKISILKEASDLKYSMPELLAFVGDLNPLGPDVSREPVAV